MAGSRPAAQKSHLWRNVRILLLLLVLFAVALRTWLDRIETQGWQTTLWVGIYPYNGDGSAQTQRYVEALSVQDFTDIEEFFSREGQRYGLSSSRCTSGSTRRVRSCRRCSSRAQVPWASPGGA
jgi:hypothetical protein